MASLVCLTAISGGVAILAAAQLHTETPQGIFEAAEVAAPVHHMGNGAGRMDMVFGQSCGTCHSGGTSLETAHLGHIAAPDHLLPLGDLHQAPVLRPANDGASLSSCQTCHQGVDQALNETVDVAGMTQLAALVGASTGPWIE